MSSQRKMPLFDYKKRELNYDTLSLVMKRFIGVFEGLRKLGFKADDIYLSISPSAAHKGAPYAFCQLRAQGKFYSAILGPSKEKDWGALQQEYKEVSTNMTSIPQKDLDRIWQESPCHNQASEFAASLLFMGFKFPYGMS
ncbi:MAG: hypothetical protein OK454_12585 [Thaumarchaeota archaeon]|nr:hypothetical protein [Nitrososphaerota archaeon]